MSIALLLASSVRQTSAACDSRSKCFPAVLPSKIKGTAVLASLNLNACGAQTTSLQISYVSQTGLASQVNVAANTFVPELQREDGSYIGTDGYNNLIALGLDGNVIWHQNITSASVITPLYATADGGATVTSTPQNSSSQLGTLYTVDKGGNVT